MQLSPRQRTILILVAMFGLLGPDAVFVYYVFFRWSEFVAAMLHPVTLSLMADAIAVMLLFAWYLAARPLGRWGWKSFLVLSLLGGLAFSVPVIVLLNEKRDVR